MAKILHDPSIYTYVFTHIYIYICIAVPKFLVYEVMQDLHHQANQVRTRGLKC